MAIGPCLGYTFTVSTPVTLTSLYGGYFPGVTVKTFWVALYTAPDVDMRGQSPDELIGSAQLPPNERFARVEIDPVLLVPGEVYLLATGQRPLGGGTAYGLASRGIDTQELVETELLIEQWGPEDGRAWRFPTLGPPSALIGVEGDSETSIWRPPHLGLGDMFVAL